MILVILTGWMFVRKAEPTEVELDYLFEWLKPQNSNIAPSALYDMLDAELVRYRADHPDDAKESTDD